MLGVGGPRRLDPALQLQEAQRLQVLLDGVRPRRQRVERGVQRHRRVGHVVERDGERLRDPRRAGQGLGLDTTHRDPEARGLEQPSGRLDVIRQRQDLRAGGVRARLHQPGDGPDRGRVAHPVRGQDRVQREQPDRLGELHDERRLAPQALREPGVAREPPRLPVQELVGAGIAGRDLGDDRRPHRRGVHREPLRHVLAVQSTSGFGLGQVWLEARRDPAVRDGRRDDECPEPGPVIGHEPQIRRTGLSPERRPQDGERHLGVAQRVDGVARPEPAEAREDRVDRSKTPVPVHAEAEQLVAAEGALAGRRDQRHSRGI